MVARKKNLRREEILLEGMGISHSGMPIVHYQSTLDRIDRSIDSYPSEVIGDKHC